MNIITDNYLDNLFRQAIRKRDTYLSCPICGNPFDSFMHAPEVCHFVKRRHLLTRWDLDNAILACHLCNHLDKSLEVELFKRGISSEDLIRKSRKSEKVDKFAIRDILLYEVRTS